MEEEVNEKACVHCNEVMCSVCENKTCDDTRLKTLKCREWRDRRAGYYCGFQDGFKEGCNKATESIDKLCEPTGGNIMADEPKRERKSYEERMKEAEEEKARKEAKLKDNNLIKEVMNSDIDDDIKVEIIKRLAQKQEPIYIPYVQSPYYDGNEREPWEPFAIYTRSPHDRRALRESRICQHRRPD